MSLLTILTPNRLTSLPALQTVLTRYTSNALAISFICSGWLVYRGEPADLLRRLHEGGARTACF
jgi:hypothetical protein